MCAGIGGEVDAIPNRVWRSLGCSMLAGFVGKTGDLFRAPEAGPRLRGLGFRDRALGPRKLITK